MIINPDVIKRGAGYPASAKFLGYVVYLPERQEFLTGYTDPALAAHKRYVRIPELALRFQVIAQAHAAASTLQRATLIGLLFEMSNDTMGVLFDPMCEWSDE